ncbi:MAG: exonuclease SbcCD subunit D C-terminal domain-containing protein [Candidatus Accumulibacter sp.]|jgi:exonuclease SbcD|nr:exonuclease SbcCD subunit D C-terminal domain-containing protein [Accumulibacter sp.]
MKILHTSDWHLGRALYGRKRYEEFEAFLAWLAETIGRNGINALLVAGDVFDTAAPGNRAQELYYRFLCRVAASSCRHVVVVAGNHDSPSFLDAPRELLKAIDVHVVGGATGTPEDEVLTLRDERGAPELIVCAVPYLRDRDIRVAEAGESADDRQRKLIEGIRGHYAAVAAVAERRRAELGAGVPIVGMGHLFTEGGRTADGDGVRELYAGSLSRVSPGIFPACFDYVALGHLHVPQPVKGAETLRYSGSPLPVGFAEAGQRKSVCQVEFGGAAASVHLIDVPVFQELERIQGDWNGIAERLAELSARDSGAWLEITYTGAEVIADLRDRLETLLSGGRMEILRVKDTRIDERVLRQLHAGETLDDLDADDVFGRCLDAHAVPEEQRPELLRAYRETLAFLFDDDSRAE